MATNLFNDVLSNSQKKLQEFPTSDLSDVTQREDQEIFWLTIIALSLSMVTIFLFA